MKLAIILATTLIVSACAVLQKADNAFLSRQMQVLHLLQHINEPLQDPELISIRSQFEPKNDVKFYDSKCIKNLMHQIENGHLIPREEIFSLFDANQRKQMKILFDCLMAAKDWDTFMGLATYVRDKMNHRQFVYGFCTALLHRNDCRGLKLPPAYEITPHMFLTTDVIRRAYQAQMQGKPAIVPMKFTGSVLNPEQRVAYFGEDIGLNSHHAHWHMDFPFWMDNQKDRAGELFFYMHHQLLARFDAERLSNYMPPVEPLQWDKPIIEGFAPAAAYPGGQEFPMRPDNVYFQDLPQRTVAEMIEFEARVRDAIDAGVIYDKSGIPIYLNGTQGINVLGALLESSTASIDPQFYGSLHNDAHLLLSRVADPKGKYGNPPGVMEHFETATRDPAFFRLHKHIDNLFKEHKDLLPPYTYDEISFPGVKIEAFKVIGESKASEPNTLITYFDESHINLGNAVNGKPVDIRAVVSRLNHEPFKMVSTIVSDKDTAAFVRVFLAPRYDWYGQEIPLNEARWSMIEIDRFTAKLNAGMNIITRKSHETVVTSSEPMSYPALIKQTAAALAGEATVFVEKTHRHCGFPHRLLLPQGRPQGMKFKLYVVLTDLSKDLHRQFDDFINVPPALSYCGVLDGPFPDTRPMGFPFDRRIPYPENFFQDNAKVIDVTIKNIKI
ncbi:hemocyanin B chain [Cephus cinctus]|uniref:Hemocyanin B chain n=1 Tax=Cephus cinctus TaxID=211228 RepID=A0AAJ7C9P2_CEPCN|nr:hemocyanin B chain [Cephus cinctus]